MERDKDGNIVKIGHSDGVGETAADSLGKNKDNLYDQLYEDMPKEVVELLMKTHPLMDEKKAEKEIERYETRHSRRSEVEAIKRARQQGSAEEEAAQPKRAAERAEARMEESPGAPIRDDDEVEEDIIQLVKHRTEPKKGLYNAEAQKKPRTVRPQEAVQPAKRRPAPEESQAGGQSSASAPVRKSEPKREGQGGKEKRRPPEAQQAKARPQKEYGAKIDMRQLEKEKTLDDFFSGSGTPMDEEESAISIPGGRKLIVGALTVFICLFGFLAFKTVSLSGQLTKANETIQELEGMKEQNDQLKIEQLSMQEEIAKLQNGGAAAQNPDSVQPAEGQEPKAEGGETLPEGSYDTYTVVAGDSPWKISQKVYGDGSHVQKILDANGLKDGDNIKEGQTLKIPKL